MEALRRKSAKKPRKASGQKEMLMPIEGKKPTKETTARTKPQRKSA